MSSDSLIKIIKERRSVRKYKAKAIPSSKIDAIKEALIWAPSAGNLQARKFFFVYNKEIISKLAHASGGQMFIAEAPLCIVCCADVNPIVKMRYGERGENLYLILDVAASVQNALLVAHNEGLGACWIAAFDENEVKSILNLPSTLRPVTLISVGYPDSVPKAPPRVSVGEACKEIN